MSLPLIVVGPVKVLTPVSTSVPAPSTSPPVPSITPLNVPDAFDSVSVSAPSSTELPATPESVVIVAPAVVAEMSKTPAASAMSTLPTLPVPVNSSVALFTVNGVFGMLPLTVSTPPLTAKLEMIVFVPVSVHWLASSFMNVSKSRNCAAEPDLRDIEARRCRPHRERKRIGAAPAKTVPLITAVGCNSSRSASTLCNRTAPPAPPFSVPATVRLVAPLSTKARHIDGKIVGPSAVRGHVARRAHVIAIEPPPPVPT